MSNGGTRTLPFSIIVPTIYGQMIVNRNDVNQTNALLKTGRAIDHHQIELLARIFPQCGANQTFIDIGANVGTFALALAPVVGPQGKVHAFEPQRIIFNMLAGTIALNSHTNVFCYNIALGDREGAVEIPQFDYSKPLNFGSVEFGSEQREPLHQARGHEVSQTEYVPLTTLDRFAFERVGIVKIDVEGMEIPVLNGARDTIRRCRPVMYIEFIKVNQGALRQIIAGLGYSMYQHEGNYLCVPSEAQNNKITQNTSLIDPLRV